MDACPVCGVLTPLHQLEAHVNSHFDDPPAPTRTRRGATDDEASARCNLCGLLVPLSQLDSHERSHASGRNPNSHGGDAAPAPAPASPSASSDVIIVSATNSPYTTQHAADGAVTGSVSGAQPANEALTAVRAAEHSGAGCSSVPSIICPYGCGQWIPVSELDSHELAHQMAGPSAAAAAAAGAAPAAAVRRTAAAGGNTHGAPAGMAVDGPEGSAEDEDWMQAGFDDTDYSLGDDAMDDAVAAAVADEEAARRLQEEQDFEALRAKYGFTNKRPGRCFSCGQEGHWSSECPQRGRAAAAPPPRLSSDPAVLAQQQRPDPQARRWGLPRLVHALKACLEGAAAGAGYRVYLCCPLQHFGATGADRGWGCGWRNIQMMSSALLLLRGHAALRDALYGGAGFVPDIGSLQAWLEVAWAAGFDPLGCESLGGRIQGDRKWIGTTEAAALLRYFGVQAQIVDFEGAGGPDAAPGSIVRGPDGATLHAAVECDLCGVCPIRGVRHRSLSRPNFDLCAACRAGGRREVAEATPYEETGTPAGSNGPTGQPPQQTQQQEQAGRLHQHQPLIDWVWRYFTGQHEPTRRMWEPAQQNQQQPNQQQGAGTGSALKQSAAGTAANAGLGSGLDAGAAGGTGAPCSSPRGGSGGPPAGGTSSSGGLAVAAAGGPRLNSSPVTITGMPPLYFQHEGHSRTIIGIERRREAGSPAPVTTLLVLDPGAPSAKLEAALTARRQWQRFVRRGLHTLTRPQYQLMYVDVVAGLTCPEERERSKIIAAAEKFRAPGLATSTVAAYTAAAGTAVPRSTV